MIFIFLAIFPTLALLYKSQLLKKRAAEGPITVTFDSLKGRPLKRIWPNFAQGGEEKELMLLPAKEEIVKLQPQYIRIDHLFDYSNIVKNDPSGKLIYDFSGLDKRIEEIISLGAVPFLSLSYFPPAISNSIIEFPATLSGWQELIQKTVQRYSGINEKNINGIYYEVWNEPDLFGSMNPQIYFNLYRATILAASDCQQCNQYKLGGPAITTLKKDWVNEFLRLVTSNNVRLDFFSWHSYQISPEKTLSEVETLKRLTNFLTLKGNVELIISEAGSVPEISSLHDSYFDASHTIAAVSLMKNSIDKMFSFELKDGPDPKGNKYWGRWGVLTYQSTGLTPKPRFYSFLYLNKLQDIELYSSEIPPGTYAIGTTNGKNSYSFLVTKLGGSETVPLTLKVSDLPPGIYSTNYYSLAQLKDPFTQEITQNQFNGGLFETKQVIQPNSSFLIEINRVSPALIKTTGQSGQENDDAAKLTSFVPPVVFSAYPFNDAEINNSLISFWFKPTWVPTDSLIHVLFETKDINQNGLMLWTEPKGFEQSLFLGLIIDNQIRDKIEIPLSSWKSVDWHQISLAIDNQKKIIGAKIDEQQASLSISNENPIKFGSFLYFGSDISSQNSAEGAIDNINVTVNSGTLYQESFNN